MDWHSTDAHHDQTDEQCPNCGADIDNDDKLEGICDSCKEPL